MSLYGTIYYQAAQGFAKLFLRNSGQNNKNFLQKTPEDSGVEAKTNSASFALESGNTWIQLEPKEDGVAFYHAQPTDSIKDLSMTYVFQKVDEPGNVAANELSSGDIIRVPLMYYDAAGHLAPVNAGAVYYKLPTVDIEADISTLESDVTQLKTDVSTVRQKAASNSNNISAQTIRIDNLATSFGSIDKIKTDTLKDMCSIVGDVGSLQKLHFDEDEKLTICDMIGENQENLEVLNGQFSEFSKAYVIDRADLISRLNKVENKNEELAAEVSALKAQLEELNISSD